MGTANKRQAMRQKLKAIWHDPVWSKVIAVGIVSLCGATWASVHFRWWPHVLKAYPVPAWLLALLFAGFVYLLFRERMRAGRRTTTDDRALHAEAATALSPIPLQEQRVNQIIPTERPKPRELRFNFCTSKVNPIYLMEERDGYSVVTMPQYYRGFVRPQPALVIEVTNRAHKDFKVDYASDVLAELVIEGTHIGPLLWLDENKSTIAFSAGHPYTLILSVAESQYSDRWIIPRRIFRQTESGYRMVDTTYSIQKGAADQLETTVALSTNGKIIYEIQLIWEWPDGKPLVTIKQ